jgi:ADP-ribose pyrophosphatase YjhB (NUDIX family)
MKPFVIRVYGILLNPMQEVLLSHEKEYGMEFIKFPGGGLEFGEGTRECLQREFLEETNQPVDVLQHFYTTDFFIESAFNPGLQLVSIYYLVKNDAFVIPQSTPQQFFFWKSLKEITSLDVTFPVDQKVVELLKQQFN